MARREAPPLENRRPSSHSSQANGAIARWHGSSEPEGISSQAVGVVGTGDPAAAWVAARQCGVISHGQLLACGLTRDAIRHRRETSRLHSLYRAVYLLGHRGAPEGSSQWAAVLACGPRVVLSFHSAGWWWAICAELQGVVDVSGTVNHGKKPGIRFHQVGTFTPGDVRSRRGLPVTSPIRTLVDLAGVLNERALERAVDEAILRRLVRERDLVEALGPSRGRPGIRRLRAILGNGLEHGASRSGVERTFRRLIAAAELPAPDFNVRVERYELDALWREYGLAVEIDSYATHGGRVPFEADRVRDADLSGLKPLRFTDRRLKLHPEAVVATLARELASRGGVGGGRQAYRARSTRKVSRVARRPRRLATTSRAPRLRNRTLTEARPRELVRTCRPASRTTALFTARRRPRLTVVTRNETRTRRPARTRLGANDSRRPATAASGGGSFAGSSW